MDNSDDYFFDDIILDDQTLATLDEEEHKYLTNPSVAPTLATPPSKRQKTVNGWQPGLGNHRRESLEDIDDLPEISVLGDGSYGLQGPRSTDIPSSTMLVNRNISNYPSEARDPLRHTVPSRTSPFVSTQPKSRTTSALRAPQKPQLRHPPRDLSHTQTPPVQAHRVSPHVQVCVDEEAEKLRLQVEELRAENMKMQATLKEAMHVRLSKEGEVSVLRKGMEKTAQDHAAQIARLKAAKEEADAQQAQMKREMKAEMERLKTEFVFKQHEIETSIRRQAPPSVRSNRISKEPIVTPVPLPSQIRDWNNNHDVIAGPSNFTDEIRHHRFGDFQESPKSQRTRKPEAIKPPGILPGFQNAFTTTPTRKGKEREQLRASKKGNEAIPILFPVIQPITSGGPPLISPPNNPSRGRTQDIDIRMDVEVKDPEDYDPNFGIRDAVDGVDVDMVDEAKSPDIEEMDQIESIDWTAELCRTILTHTLSPSNSLTFQMLMRVPTSTVLSPPLSRTYSTACERVLESLVRNSKYKKAGSNMNAVSESFIQMTHILNAANLLPPLTALLNLLIQLIYIIPLFSSSLLSNFLEGTDQPWILVIACEIIRSHLAPIKKGGSNIDILLLGKETVGLLEALCWNVPENMQEKLATILHSPDVLSTILDPIHPPSLLSHSIHLLVLLATYQRGDPKLFRALLSFPETNDLDAPQSPMDFSKIPHIERLCSYLVDTHRKYNETKSMKVSILTFIAMLSISHADAPAMLMESQTLIPSLVLFLIHSTTPLWEDDEDLISSLELIASSIRILNQTVFLLHHLVFSTKPPFNLRHKLHHAPHRQFNGITHMFIVAFGRLSYADPPEWIDHQGKTELEQIAEMARDVLELVVEGPEGDSIWAAYQGESEHESVTDDEEIEARRLDTTDAQ